MQVPDTEQFTDTAVFTGSLPSEGGDLCFDFDAEATTDTGPMTSPTFSLYRMMAATRGVWTRGRG